MKLSLLIISLMMLAVSCGKDSSSGSGSAAPNAFEAEEAVKEGDYKAILRVMNFRVNGWFAYGNAEFKVKGDNLQVTTYLDDDAPVTHLQSVHAGSRCPEMSDDTNGDGVVDMNEAYAVVGPVLIPLDADLTSREAGQGIYPKGTGFTYQRSTSIKKLEAELGGPLALGGRVVLIHGTAANDVIPETAEGPHELPKHLELPMVCGIIKSLGSSSTP